MYIDDLNYQTFSELCQLLNVNNSWSQLGGAYNFNVLEIELIGRNENPAKNILLKCHRHGSTVDDLIIKLIQIKDISAAKLLQDATKSSSNSSISLNSKNPPEIIIPLPQSNPNYVKEKSMLPIPPPSYRTTIDNKPSSNNICPAYYLPDKPKIILSNIKTDKSESLKIDNSFFQKLNSIDCLLYNDLVNATYENSKTKPSITEFNYKNLIGQGGFGTVYKGWIKNEPCAIKVFNKKIKSDLYSSFELEINSLTKYKHVNIIKLFGHSVDGPYKCIVYEFMSNASLRDRLDCKNGTKSLTWTIRHKILLDVASGLDYMHTTYEQPLVHGDIKSSNILLDDRMNAKLSDFGLARDATGGQKTNIYTNVVSRNDASVQCTIAYMPFEFFQTRRLTISVDVHCFGVVILETITGQQPCDKNNNLLREKMTDCQSVHSIKDPCCIEWPNEYCQQLFNLGVTCISTKKEKSTDCDSALIPLLCVHG